MPIKEFNFGPFTIHAYGLIIAASIIIGLFLAKKRASLYKIPPKIFESYTLVVPLVLGVIVGRLYHVVDQWRYYAQNPSLITRVDLGGLGIFGALAGIILGFYIIARLKKINLLELLDLISPPLLLAQAIGRIGNYINQEGYGPPTNLPWGVEINGVRVHPTFFYEAILDAIFFLVLLKVSKKLKNPGQLFGLYLVLYSLGRFIVEFWRIDTAIIGGFKTAQVISIFTIVLGIYFAKRQRKT